MGYPKTDPSFPEMFAPIAWFRIPVEDARAKMREMLSQRYRIALTPGDTVQVEGFYADIQSAPFHAVIVGRKEAREHLLVLMEGCAEVVTDKGLVAVGQAPGVLKVGANERLVANVLTARLVYACIHGGEPPAFADEGDSGVQ